MDFKPSIDDVCGVWAQYLLQGNGWEEFEELRSCVDTVIIEESIFSILGRIFFNFPPLPNTLAHRTYNNVSNGFLSSARNSTNGVAFFLVSESAAVFSSKEK